MKITGILKHKFDTNIITDRLCKRDFVVDYSTRDKYNKEPITFTLVGNENCAMINGINDGDEIDVHFVLKGREWVGKNGARYFNSLEAWHISITDLKGNTNDDNSLQK